MGSNGGGVCCRPATGWLSTRLPGKARGLPPAPKAESLLLKKTSLPHVILMISRLVCQRPV